MAVPIPAGGEGFIMSCVHSAELHDILLFVLVIVFVGAFIGGPVFKALVGSAIRFFGGKTDIQIQLPGGTVPTNLTPAKCEGCDQVVDPAKCVMHQAEHERSLQNQKAIGQLWEKTSKIRDDMIAGFKEVATKIDHSNKTIMSGQLEILAALGRRPRDWQDEGSGGGGGFGRGT
jgi:hypothetical protein